MKIKVAILIIWTLCLLALLSIPMAENNLPRTGIFQYSDKIGHMGLFAVTGFLAVWGMAFFPNLRYRLLFGLTYGLALGAGTEFGQMIIPYRTADVNDFIANLAGLFFGAIFFMLLYAWKQKL